MRLGEVSANHLQHHFAMLKVLANAFGGSESSSEGGRQVKSEADVAALNEIFKV